MIKKSKLAFIVAVTLASIASPVLAQTANTTAHRHHHVHRPLSSSQIEAGRGAYGSIPQVANPADDPAMTGGGNEGYNACAGHARC